MSLSLQPGSEEIPLFIKLLRAIFCRGFSDNFCDLVMFQFARHFKRNHNNIAIIEAYVEVLAEYAKRIEVLTSNYERNQELRVKLKLRAKNMFVMLQGAHVPTLCERMLYLLTWLNRKRIGFGMFDELLENYALHCSCGNGPQIFYVLFLMMFDETLASPEEFSKIDRNNMTAFFAGELKALIELDVEPSVRIMELILTKMLEIEIGDAELFFSVMNSFSVVYRSKANMRNYFLFQNTSLAVKVVAKLSQMNTHLSMSVLESILKIYLDLN